MTGHPDPAGATPEGTVPEGTAPAAAVADGFGVEAARAGTTCGSATGDGGACACGAGAPCCAAGAGSCALVWPTAVVLALPVSSCQLTAAPTPSASRATPLTPIAM